MQHEITQAIPLLDEQGELTQPGWARRLLPVYDRSRVRGGPLRLKERDCYLVMNRQCALALTISDNRYMGMDSISLIDLWEAGDPQPHAAHASGRDRAAPELSPGQLRQGRAGLRPAVPA